MTELKRLNTVPDLASKSMKVAEAAYSTAKTYVPEKLQPTVSKIEQKVTEIGAPYATLAQDKATDLLKAVDGKVDQAVTSATTVYQNNTAYLQQQLEKQKTFHAQNVESYKTAREEYLKKVESSIDYLKQNGITGAAKVAADEVSAQAAKARDLPNYLIKQVQESFEKLLEFEPVHKLLDGAKPAVDAAFSRYMAIHDSVVATPQYKRVYDLGQTVVTRAQSTFVYRQASQKLYPVAAPYVEPAVAAVMESPYYKAAVEHITPAATVA